MIPVDRRDWPSYPSPPVICLVTRGNTYIVLSSLWVGFGVKKDDRLITGCFTSGLRFLSPYEDIITNVGVPI